MQLVVGGRQTVWLQGQPPDNFNCPTRRGHLISPADKRLQFLTQTNDSNVMQIYSMALFELFLDRKDFSKLNAFKQHKLHPNLPTFSVITVES